MKVNFITTYKKKIKLEVTPEVQYASDYESEFINRKKEIQNITEFLNQKQFRGLKLLGMPGIGKRSILKELKNKRTLNENCFEFYFQDEVDRLEDILSSLFTKLGIGISIIENEYYDLRSRNTRGLLNKFYFAFDQLNDATIIFYNIHNICDSKTNKIKSPKISDFFKILISRQSYKGNKIIFSSDTNFKLDVDSEVKLYEESLSIFNTKHIKELMRNEFTKRGHTKFAEKILSIEDEVLHESVNGHPQISKLFVKVAESYGVDNLLNDIKLKKHFTEKHKVNYLLSKIEITDMETSILETLSLFNDYINFDFISDYSNYSNNHIEGLINKFLLEKIVLEQGILKYYVPTLVKDIIKAKTSEKNLHTNHNKIGDYYWAISENLDRKSSDILNGYRNAFYHYTESNNLEKINFLSLRFQPKIIQKAFYLFKRKYFIGAWSLFNEVYKSGNLHKSSHLVKYLESEIIVDKKEEDTLLKITKAIDENPNEINLKVVYAKYLYSTKNFLGAKDICEDLIKDVYPTRNNKLNILYPRVLLGAGLTDEAVLRLKQLVSHLEKGIDKKPSNKYPLITSYSLLVDAELRRFDDLKSIVKNCIRNLEKIGIGDQQLYGIIESETELTEDIIEKYEESKNISLNNFELFIRYLARRKRIEKINSFFEKAKNEFKIDNHKLNEFMLKNWIEKSDKDDNLFFYIKNKMSLTPNIEYDEITDLENFLSSKNESIQTLIDYCTKASVLKVDMNQGMKMDFIELLEYKELFINLNKIVFLSKNEDAKRKFLENNLKNIVYVEGETDELYLKKAIKILERNHLDISIVWIGDFDSRGNVSFSGDTALNQTFNYYKANPQALNLNKKIILLYDSDTNKPHQDFKNLFIRKMEKNESNQTFKIGIENLLTINEGFDLTPFYNTKTKIDDYGGESTVKKIR